MAQFLSISVFNIQLITHQEQVEDGTSFLKVSHELAIYI